MKDLVAFVASQADLLISALTILALTAAFVLTYWERRSWEGRLFHWQNWLGARIDVLHTLIADGQEIQRSYSRERDPLSAHDSFVDRCDASLREHFGAAYAARIEARSGTDWERPPGLVSDELVFALYDTERRLAGLEELLGEVEADIASLDG
jgi:hypothetical protein